MSTTNFWVYDVERGYIRLIDQVAERADKTHYLYKHHSNITRAATGQQRLTRFTYIQVWRAINAGHFEPSDIKAYILKKKTEIAESKGVPSTASLSFAKKKRDANRAKNHQDHLRKQAALQATMQQLSVASAPATPIPSLEIEKPVAFVQAEVPLPSSISSISISDESTDSGNIVRPISPSVVYTNCDEAMILARLEEPEVLKVAQMKVCKHLLKGGEGICYPITDFSMDVTLSSNGIPCDPDLLYSKLEAVAERRGFKFDCQLMYKDLKRAYGHVRFIPRLPSPECYQYSRY